jgi:uncharacterized MAPEG superfamily protein
MTTELQMLVLASLLSVALAFPPLIALIVHRGLAYAAGNRDENLALPTWGTRAERAQKNLLANLPAFGALVLVAAAAGVSNEATVWGAQMFFWARVAHAIIYVAGIPYVRAVAFIASLSGMFGLAREIFGAWSVAMPGA